MRQSCTNGQRVSHGGCCTKADSLVEPPKKSASQRSCAERARTKLTCQDVFDAANAIVSMMATDAVRPFVATTLLTILSMILRGSVSSMPRWSPATSTQLFVAMKAD